MTRITRIVLFLAAVLAAAPAAAQDSTVVFIVRHGEKASIPGEQDPPLSEAGQARARALADALRGQGVDAIRVTLFRRTQETAFPLANEIQVTPMIDEVGSDVLAHASRLAERVRTELAGKTILVVGHSNTVRRIVTALGGPEAPDLCDREYANLFVVVLKPGAEPRFERRTFGTPDPEGADTCPRR
ncbi:MAG TPA: phosphoglycerate mutase family protein [Longimicrobium sp.]|nr:phosphoglycerate mutase family protein [Longimicrobium sp.]